MPDSRQLTPGKVRGLAATSTTDGVFTILAIDHRDSLRVLLDPEDPDGIPGAQLTTLKLELLEAVGERASAVMLEPEYSAAQAIVTRTLPGHVGFLVALEAQGYLGDPTARRTTILEGWSVEKAKRLGANGIKLLVLYRPDAGEVTDSQDALISSVVTDCRTHDIPLFLEPLAYAIGITSATATSDLEHERRSMVIETVRRLTSLGPDVLKVQFPIDTGLVTDRGVWADACAELDEVATVPWALLSGGDPFEVFKDQVRIACQAGASGFMVGRALWGRYVASRRGEPGRPPDGSLASDFQELAAIATADGQDWKRRHEVADIGSDWFLDY